VARARLFFVARAVDYFAIYLIPVNAWYIVPQAVMGKTCTIHFTVHSKRHKYAKYREAWDLLRGGAMPGRVDRIFGCEEGGADIWNMPDSNLGTMLQGD
jgi:hypothetical protein